jgi:ribose transport system permease protein
MKAVGMKNLRRLLADYGMALVLLLLCIVLSVLTLAEQDPEGAPGGEQAADLVLERVTVGGRVLVAVGATPADAAFAEALANRLQTARVEVVEVVHDTRAARKAFERLNQEGRKLDAIAATGVTEQWLVFDNIAQEFSSLGQVPVVAPRRYVWPNFLKSSNLSNIASQISVVAILAIGMTFVIITGGIDLSVGSLIALSAVLSTVLIRDYAGAEGASAAGMVGCCLAAIVVCAAVGLFSGSMVTLFQVPPFIVTLAILWMASGLAFILSNEQSISQVPPGFAWLGSGTSLFGLRNCVVLMVVLYAAAHIVMTRMTLGRYIYAVGGSREAARLSGVPVRRVLVFVFTLSAALAGLGGVVLASQLVSGAPNYGQMYELATIAAVVVGGTSLSGGEGKVLGTLIGAFIIAVIQNGMNLLGITSNPQRVVLGAVILVAVVLDRVKKHGLPWRTET